MTAETDAEFVERVALVFEHEGYVADIDWPILFALARRGAEAEAEYSDGYHDGYENGADATAHWVADYEHVKSEITRLRAALRDLLRLVDEDPEEDDPSPYLFDRVCDNARAALGDTRKAAMDALLEEDGKWL